MHIAAAAALTLLGLLHKRPLQHWFHESRGGHGSVALTGSKLHRPVTKPSPCGQILRFFGQECPWNRSSGMLWSTWMPPPPTGGPHTQACSVGDVDGPPSALAYQLLLLAVRLALDRLKGCLRGNTATVVYINRQVGLRSHRMSQLTHHVLHWSRKILRSLCAIHIPCLLNRTADELSQATLPGEW